MKRSLLFFLMLVTSYFAYSANYPAPNDSDITLMRKRLTSLADMNPTWIPIVLVGTVQPVSTLYPEPNDNETWLNIKMTTALAYMATNGVTGTGTGSSNLFDVGSDVMVRHDMVITNDLTVLGALNITVTNASSATGMQTNQFTTNVVGDRVIGPVIFSGSTDGTNALSISAGGIISSNALGWMNYQGGSGLAISNITTGSSTVITNGTLTLKHSGNTAPALVINTNWMVLTNGNTGFGVANPTNKLDILSTVQGQTVNIRNTGGGSDTNGIGQITLGLDNPYWTFRESATPLADLAIDRTFGGTNYEAIRIQRSTGRFGIGGSTSPTAKLQVDGTVGSLMFAVNTNRFVITNSFVGIGTSTPKTNLDVAGEIKANSMSLSNGLSALNMTTPTNTPTDAYVMTATGTDGATAWKVAAAGTGSSNITDSGWSAVARNLTVSTNLDVTGTITAGTMNLTTLTATNVNFLITNQFIATGPNGNATGTLNGAAWTNLTAGNITGVIPIANLASGAPDGTKFIRDDGTLVVPTAGASGTGMQTNWYTTNLINTPTYIEANGGSTPTNIFVLTNSATASSGNQKYGPFISSIGKGWANGSGLSEPLEFSHGVAAIQGTGNYITGYWVLMNRYSSLGAMSAWSTNILVGVGLNAGMTLSGTLTTSSGGIIAEQDIRAGTAYKFNWNGRSQMKSPADGRIQIYDSTGTNGAAIEVSSLVATNGITLGTNFTSGLIAPAAGHGKLVISNNVLYFVTSSKTNLINDGN